MYGEMRKLVSGAESIFSATERQSYGFGSNMLRSGTPDGLHEATSGTLRALTDKKS